jgi:hypothetical protein
MDKWYSDALSSTAVPLKKKKKDSQARGSCLKS